MADEKDLVELLVQNLDVGNGTNSSISSSSSTTQESVSNHANTQNSSHSTHSQHGGKQRKGGKRGHSSRNSLNDRDFNGYPNQPYMYSNMDRSRDREWAEYVQFMNLPGLHIPAHAFPQHPTDSSNQTLNNNGIPIPTFIAPTQEEGVYNLNQHEADFVQRFVGNGPQYLPYLHPGYFQHPGFSSQVYDGRNVFSNSFYPYQQVAMGPPISEQYDQNYNQNYSNYPQKVQTSQTTSNDKSHSKESQNGETQIYNSMSNLTIQEGKPSKKSQAPPSGGPKSWAQMAATAATKTQAAVTPPPVPTKVPKPVTQNSQPKPKQEAPKPAETKAEAPKKGAPSSPRPEFTEINPSSFDYNPSFARFFVIKSYSEDDIHKSIKYGIWASTDSGNKRLDSAFKESSQKGPLYLFFSVNASGQFCGMAQMMSSVDYEKKCEWWMQDKWKGQFQVKWIFIKDIPNNQFRHIRLENNDNKPVTNSRDTQEIFLEPGREILKIFTNYKPKTSILDDFNFYDKRQEMMKEKKLPEGPVDSENSEEVPTGSNRAARVRGSSKPPTPNSP